MISFSRKISTASFCGITTIVTEVVDSLLKMVAEYDQIEQVYNFSIRHAAFDNNFSPDKRDSSDIVKIFSKSSLNSIS
jgi:hypothetical protein